MDDVFAMDETLQLIAAASDFAFYPGVQTDGATKTFLDRFPLQVLINTLNTRSDTPEVQRSLVACLERVFNTKYGARFIPQYMPFLQIGLRAESQAIRRLACKAATSLLENLRDESPSPAQLIIGYDIYPLLLDCLINGDEEVATASTDAIKKLADFPEGKDIIFPADTNEATHLRNLAARCSSLGRVRVLSLIVKLFSVSITLASAVYYSQLLSLLEAEVSKTNDTLVVLSVLELFYELAEIQHGTEFLSRTTLLELLHSIVSNTSIGTILRSRALMISGRLLSKENIFMFIDESSVKSLISAIDGRFDLLGTQDTDEYETTLEALGRIGSSTKGATLLLSSSPPAARHLINAAFDRQGRGKQLAALHALGDLAGETRSENNIILSSEAEESLRQLVYEVASKSSKMTPSGLFLSVLQQASEIRLGGYRMLTGLVARPWCLMEICSKQEIINIVTDATTETTKLGMESKYKCCKAIQKAFLSSNLVSDPALDRISEKLLEAVSRGPYLARRQVGAQPAVMTADRF